MGNDYNISIQGTVPLVCWINERELMCNAAEGYILFDRAPDGTLTMLEVSDGPQLKEHGYVLADGHEFVIEPRG